MRLAQGQVTVDLGRKTAGRGAYLCPSLACWEQGMKKDRLDHALRGRMSPEDRQRLQEFAKTMAQQV